jgi:hypothetical protein
VCVSVKSATTFLDLCEFWGNLLGELVDFLLCEAAQAPKTIVIAEKIKKVN